MFVEDFAIADLVIKGNKCLIGQMKHSLLNVYLRIKIDWHLKSLLLSPRYKCNEGFLLVVLKHCLRTTSMLLWVTGGRPNNCTLCQIQSRAKSPRFRVWGNASWADPRARATNIIRISQNSLFCCAQRAKKEPQEMRIRCWPLPSSSIYPPSTMQSSKIERTNL